MSNFGSPPGKAGGLPNTVKYQAVNRGCCVLALKNNPGLASNNETRTNFELAKTKFTKNTLKIFPEKSRQNSWLSWHYPIHKI
jgi:hypothetical protein